MKHRAKLQPVVGVCWWKCLNLAERILEAEATIANIDANRRLNNKTRVSPNIPQTPRRKTNSVSGNLFLFFVIDEFDLAMVAPVGGATPPATNHHKSFSNKQERFHKCDKMSNYHTGFHGYRHLVPPCLRICLFLMQFQGHILLFLIV